MAGTERHAGLPLTRLTVMPGDGAAVGWPLLSKLIVIEVPKLAFNVADVCTMLSAAVVVAVEVAKL